MSHKNIFSHLLKASRHSLSGLQAIFKSEIAFRLEVFLTVLLIPLAVYFKVTAVEKIILISSWFLVLIVEALNTALETVVNRISLEIHPLSKKIKDIGSAAVLLAVVNALITWSVILFANYF